MTPPAARWRRSTGSSRSFARCPSPSGRAGPARRSPSGQRQRASRRQSSTAGATATTATCAPSRRPCARQASPSDAELRSQSGRYPLVRMSTSVDRSVSPAGLGLQECVVETTRVAKVLKGGRRFSFTALVVVGDERDVVGVGYGKANEVPLAIQKGVDQAKKNLFPVPKHGSTITPQTLGQHGSRRGPL